MKKYECIVKRGKMVEKIVRYFTSSEQALAWLELEGYQVLALKN